MSTPYTPAWRQAVRAGAAGSARQLVPTIIGMLGATPRSVIDVGCGEGWFLAEFERSGVINTVGVEDERTENRALAAAEFVPVDLASDSYPSLGSCDLAISLEVAEHVPDKRAGDLVGWLCSLAPVVVFSAALPGQGGPGHINERWPEYWSSKFSVNGYEGTGALRWQVWSDSEIEPWYRQNLLVFAEDLSSVGLVPDGCPSVIHPGMWEWKGHA